MSRGDPQSVGLPPDGHSPGGEDAQPRSAEDSVSTTSPVETETDRKLVDSALRGDMQAFADLFERYRPSLYARCLKYLSDPSLAEDVVQEVFLRGLSNLPSFDRSKKIWPWLATIAGRMCIDLQRRRSFTHYLGDIGVAMDADANGGALDENNSALDAVLQSERRAELWEFLDVLPKRQRRVFLLFALDGWSCPEIAEAEGISAAAVRRLLFRARQKMRAARRSGRFTPVVFPITWLRWKVQRMEERVRPLFGAYSEGFASFCVQAVCLGAVAAMVIVSSDYPDYFKGGDTALSDGTGLSVHSQPAHAASLPPVLSHSDVVAKSLEPKQSMTDPASSLITDVINPNQKATPEDSSIYSFTVSPNYESDHTIFALGKSVLFVSHDGGANWKPRPSRLLSGSTIVLPPRFPQDGRIFTYGGIFGLQQSDDGGEIFRTVSANFGQGIAISPSFGKEDSKILISGKTTFEFNAATGLTQPALPALIPADQGYFPIAFSPNYQTDSTVFIAEGWGGASYRCRGLFCDVMPLPTQGQLTFRFSPQCDQAGVAYAFTPFKLLVSRDNAQTFEEVSFPVTFRDTDFSYARSIKDVAILCNGASDPAIFASVVWSPSSSSQESWVYRSFDAGRSWSRTYIDLPGFYGAKNLIVMRTGRLLATGLVQGIACSVDLGETWAPRCPTEH